jgi:hypothetical protein
LGNAIQCVFCAFPVGVALDLLVTSFQLSAERKIVNIKKGVLSNTWGFTARDYPYDAYFRPGTDHSSISLSVMKHMFFKHGFVAIKDLDRKRNLPNTSGVTMALITMSSSIEPALRLA